MNDDGGLMWQAQVGQQEEYELTHVFPPIPDRSHDWQAQRAGADPDDPAAWGATPEEAIKNLNELESLK